MAMSQVKVQTIVDHYLAMAEPNERQALRECGYKESYVQNPSRVFGKPEVQAYLELRRKQIQKEAGIDPEAIAQRLKKIAMGDLNKYIKVNEEDGSLYYDFKGASPDDLALIQEVQVETSLTGKVKKFRVSKLDALRATEILNKMLGLNAPDKVEGEVTVIDRLNAGRRRVKEARES